MIRQAALLFTAVTLLFQSNACDVCGGANPSNSMGFMPGNTYHFIGMRSIYKRYCSQHISLVTGNSTFSTEYFLSTEITGKYQLSKRWQLVGVLPYSFAAQEQASGSTQQNGIGDASIFTFYTPHLRVDSVGNILAQLNVGGGLKLPTGNYARNAHETSNIYPGSGAADVTVSLNYLHQVKKTGFQLEASNTYRFSNSAGYQFGNALSISGNFFVKITAQNTVWRPFVGVQFNSFGKDRINGKINSESVNNGYYIGGKVGVNYIRSNWFISLYGEIPAYQNIGNNTVKQQERLSLSINYLILKKKKK
jgi:hypothetical protein